jgi:hypothetical protein
MKKAPTEFAEAIVFFSRARENLCVLYKQAGPKPLVPALDGGGVSTPTSRGLFLAAVAARLTA